MEASQVLRRSFVAAIKHTTRCECAASNPRFTAPRSWRRPAHSRWTAAHPFSTASRRWLEQVSKPNIKASGSLTHPSSPARTTPKQALQTYIDAVHKIVDGHQLGKKENLRQRLHSDLMTALARAEARLNAPHTSPESYEPILKSLKDEAVPILHSRFGMTDVSQIIAGIGSPEFEVQTTPQGRLGVADLLDNSFASAAGGRTDAQKWQDIDGMNMRAESARSAKLLTDSIYGSTINSSISRADRAYQDIHAGRAKGASLRLSPSLGKSIEVTGGVDLTRAFQKMEAICGRNRVRSDLMRQRFHVRRGQDKKNRRIERWRKLFKEGFIAECSRVRRMRRQGW